MRCLLEIEIIRYLFYPSDRKIKKIINTFKIIMYSQNSIINQVSIFFTLSIMEIKNLIDSYLDFFLIIHTHEFRFIIMWIIIRVETQSMLILLVGRYHKLGIDDNMQATWQSLVGCEHGVNVGISRSQLRLSPTMLYEY